MKRCGDDETVRKAYGMWDYLNMEQVILNTPTGAITDTQPVFDWEPVYER